MSQLTEGKDVDLEITKSERLLIFLARDATSATALLVYLLSLVILIAYYFSNSNEIDDTTAVSVYIAMIGLLVFLTKSLKDLLKYYKNPYIEGGPKRLQEAKDRKEAIYDFFGLISTFLLTAFGVVFALYK